MSEPPASPDDELVDFTSHVGVPAAGPTPTSPAHAHDEELVDLTAGVRQEAARRERESRRAARVAREPSEAELLQAADAEAVQRRRRRLVIGLALLSPCVCLTGLVGGGAFFALTTREVPIGAADRQVAVQCEDFAPDLRSPPIPELGTWTKERAIDGSLELDYAYDDGELRLEYELSVDRRASDAVGTYGATLAFLRVRINADEDTPLVLTARDDLLRWGDRSSCYVLSQGGAPRGYAFLGRQGKRTVLVIVRGPPLAEGRTLAKVLRPRLDAVAGYRP